MPLLNALLIWAVLGQAATPAAGQSGADLARDAAVILEARCFVCHGSGQQMHGLRLDQREDALRGSNSGPVIVPGKSGESKLIQMVSGTIEGKIMPPAGQRLTPQEIAVLRGWIDQGAQWSAVAAEKAPGAASESTHWAFRSIRRPAIPDVKNRSWARNPIDNFVLARLEAEGIEPSPEASRSTLIRRLSLDLTGLPPTPAETAAFAADESPGAYERLVDRLLESPHYGEKWARHWLDLARYSDSDGYRQDDFRPHAWRFRRWVIDAFNQDMPFDRFTTEQIAGDVLPNSTIEQKVATGFHRNTPSNREGGTDFQQFRFEQVVNRINTIGTVWLGLTVGCAQCHDHKYDPLSHKQYYQLFAFMDNVEEVNIDAPLPGEMGPYLRSVEAYRKARRDLLEQYRVPELQPAWEAKLLEAMANPGKWQEWDKALGTVRVGDSHPVFAMGEKILRTPPEKRNEKEARILTDNYIRYSSQVVPEKVYKEELKFDELLKKLKELDDGFPALSQAQTIAVEREPHPTYIHLRGEFKQLGSQVEPGFPSFLHKPPADPLPPRVRLAKWIVSPDNPLTARVTVNRLWQELFGRGIVLTSENFGTQGEKPSHPALLDWLACDFRDGGWSVKQTIRKIVLSSTYRQASLPREDLKVRDPDNMLLARQARFRLTAESIRDSALTVSGLLAPEIGGKSIRPPRPAGAKMARGKWTESPGEARYGRSLYIQYQRMSPHPFMTNFDMADGYSAVCRRARSNTALQALNLLNDPAFFEAAQALAVRVLTEAPPKPEERLDYAFRLCLARTPEPDEREWLATAIRRQQEILREKPELAQTTFPYSLPGVSSVDGAAWVGAGRVLLNLYEFMTRE